jgi:hypothetical protein
MVLKVFKSRIESFNLELKVFKYKQKASNLELKVFKSGLKVVRVTGQVYPLPLDIRYISTRPIHMCTDKPFWHLRKLFVKSMDEERPLRTRIGLPTYRARSGMFESYSESTQPTV